MHNTKVAIKVCKEYNIKAITKSLDEAFNLLGGLSSFIKPNSKVLIKPDLYCRTEPNIAKTTHPALISALAELINKCNASCIIADSPKGDFNQSVLDKTYVKTQMLNASNNGHATLNTNDNISIFNNESGYCAKQFYLINAINDADIIINVGKFRSDKHLGLIGCGQNLFGLVGGKMKNLIQNRCYTSKKFCNYNIDLFDILENKIVLNILDGIVSCEANNDPRILNTILVSENPYAVDYTALKIINQEPEKNILLTEASARGKFKFNVELLGDNIESLIHTDYHYNNSQENIFKYSTSSLKRKYNSTQKRAIIPSKTCKGCKVCVSVCPMKAINIKSSPTGEYALIDYDKCVNCLRCVNNCPYKIIQTKTPQKYKTIENNINKKLKNK